MTERMIANEDKTRLIKISEIEEIEAKQVKLEYHILITKKNKEVSTFQKFDSPHLEDNRDDAISFMRKIEKEINRD